MKTKIPCIPPPFSHAFSTAVPCTMANWLMPVTARGEVLVSEWYDNKIAGFDQTTGAYVGDFVKQGSGGLSEAAGMAFGPDGNLYVASCGSNSVLRYNGTTGAFIDAFVATGSGGLALPNALEFGPDGSLYVSSSVQERLKARRS